MIKKSSAFAKRALFSQTFVSNILCLKNKKKTFLKFLFQKQVLTFLVYKNKKKTKAFIYKTFQNSAHFVREFAYTTKNKTDLLFFLLRFQNEATKNQTNNVTSFFSFSMLFCKTIKHFFVSQLMSKINKPLVYLLKIHLKNQIWIEIFEKCSNYKWCKIDQIMQNLKIPTRYKLFCEQVSIRCYKCYSVHLQ